MLVCVLPSLPVCVSFHIFLCSIYFCLNLFELASKLDPWLGQPSGLLRDFAVEAKSPATSMVLFC